MSDLIFEPHSDKQQDVLSSTKPVTIAATGIQWGKTSIGVIRLKLAMHEYVHPTDNFIITSPTYKILYQSTLPPFLYWNKGIGTYDKKNECFHIKGGGKVWFRTGTDPDSVVGITNVRHILCDEAGLYSLYFWENIQARASFKEAPITIVTSPYSLNWLYRDYIRKVRSGDEYAIKQTHLCQAKSSENPYFPLAEYESKRRTMEPRRFNMMYGGNFDKAQGLVYSCFDSSKHWVDPINLPPGTRFLAGVDWGYTHPFVIVVRAITPLGMHYQVAEFYQTQLMIGEKIDAAHRLKSMYPIEKFIADSANPDDIAEFNRAGLRCVAANKDIKAGIEAHWELINSGYYQVFRGGNNHTIDEYEMYHYPEVKDLRPDQSDAAASDLPVDKDNHCIAEGTPIFTDKGLVPIENIKIGDRVRTRSGFNVVTNAWCASENGQILILKTKTGKQLQCTPDHKIWTKRGFVKAIYLRYDDILISIGEKKWKQLHGTENVSEDIQTASDYRKDDTSKEYQTENHYICTEKYGFSILGIFQRVFIYIILTVTLRIMTSKILNASVQKIMPTSIQVILKKREQIYLRLVTLQKHGIAARKESNYIKGLASSQQAGKYQSKRNVLNAKMSSIQTGLIKTINFVQMLANHRTEDKAESMILMPFANIAKQILLKINMLKRDLVADPVQSIYLTSKRKAVFDLTVENEHEFFADGILVSNCMDCNRYLSIATFTTSKKPNKIITSENQDIIPVRIVSPYDTKRDKLISKKRSDVRIL